MFGRSKEVDQKYKEYLKQFKGDCPFCSKKIRNSLIEETDLWMTIVNKFPYMGLSRHSVCLPKRHIVSINELNMIETVEMIELIKKYTEKNRVLINGGGTCSIGDHFHFHIIAE